MAASVKRPQRNTLLSFWVRFYFTSFNAACKANLPFSSCGGNSSIEITPVSYLQTFFVQNPVQKNRKNLKILGFYFFA